MRSIWQFACLGLTVLLLGCNTKSLETLRQTTPQGSAFHAALAELYLSFAESEATQYDWWSSGHFADKGLVAAQGFEVPIEAPEDWNIPEHARAQLASAHASLSQALTLQLREAQPKRAAHMQFYYECWLEQQEEAWQEADIETCRRNFFATLNETDAPVISAIQPDSSYLLYFPWDEAVLSQGQTYQELQTIAASLKHSEYYEIVINGHADRSGTDTYNMELSENRARFVSESLVASGVRPDRIHYYAFGESDPRLPTLDGVREPTNRRVEIFIE